MLTEFVRANVVKYLEHDEPYFITNLSGLILSRQIRKEAALTCCKLLVQPSCSAPTRGYCALVISEILSKLLIVGIADPGVCMITFNSFTHHNKTIQSGKLYFPLWIRASTTISHKLTIFDRFSLH